MADMVFESAEMYEIMPELECRDAVDYRLCGLRSSFLDGHPHLRQQHLYILRKRSYVLINVPVFLHDAIVYRISTSVGLHR